MGERRKSRYDFVCYGCGAVYPRDTEARACAVCREPLSVRATADVDRAVFDSPPDSLWHYADLLPIDAPDAAVSLGEGATPLIDAPRLAGRFGFDQVLIKNEAANPTGSFKDRQISVGITHARECGADTVAVVSSGNVACAAAAYAARAGMRAVLLMHGQASGAKPAQAAAYGACALRVDSPSAGAVFSLCIEACRAFGWYHLSTAGLYEPFNVEGAKTIAYELYRQTGGDLPDWVVAPVGGGGLLGGIWRGLLDLRRLGLIERVPRLAGAQAAGCAPFVQAVRDGTPFLDTLERPWPNPRSVAGGIADDIIFDGHTALPAVRETDGAAIAVDDAALLDAEARLAAEEGLLCEPSSAVVFAALPHLPVERGAARVCCLLTGHGVKDLDALEGRVPPPRPVAPELAAVKAALGETS